MADAFISIYDTIVNDRGLIAANGSLGRLLKLVERRAYAAADSVVVDTVESQKFYSRLFDLPASKFPVVPLSTNEDAFLPAPYNSANAVCKVLFVGTMVPLQGIDTILAAAELLKGRPDIRLRLIGDGQEAARVARRIEALPNVEWERTWQSSGVLASEIARADICLGIFGSGQKTQRVCPFKIYAYAAVGRAIVTSDTTWLRGAVAEFGGEPFSTIPAADAVKLANRIAALADDPQLRVDLARKSREFYEDKLSNNHAMKRLFGVLYES